jgi:hypothetical protein
MILLPLCVSALPLCLSYRTKLCGIALRVLFGIGVLPAALAVAAHMELGAILALAFAALLPLVGEAINLNAKWTVRAVWTVNVLGIAILLRSGIPHF